MRGARGAHGGHARVPPLHWCQASSGGTIGGAVKLNKGQSDVSINWAGGLHHAKKCEVRASGTKCD